MFPASSLHTRGWLRTVLRVCRNLGFAYNWQALGGCTGDYAQILDKCSTWGAKYQTDQLEKRSKHGSFSWSLASYLRYKERLFTQWKWHRVAPSIMCHTCTGHPSRCLNDWFGRMHGGGGGGAQSPTLAPNEQWQARRKGWEGNKTDSQCLRKLSGQEGNSDRLGWLMLKLFCFNCRHIKRKSFISKACTYLKLR